jgi:hypothetical protein
MAVMRGFAVSWEGPYSRLNYENSAGPPPPFPHSRCRFQLERLGYFCVDVDSKPGKMILNRTVTLKESFPKQTLKK